MTKHIFMLLSAAALFVCSTAIGSAREHTWEARACTEKRTALAKLEAEAPGLHAKVAKLQGEYAAAQAVETNAITGMTEGIRTGMGGDLGVGLDVGRFGFVDAARKNRENKQIQLDAAIEREKYVGPQIFLLRDIIAGLPCDTPTPPVDYGAINQFGEQSQQSGPGGTSQAGSGAFGPSVVEQGKYATPSPGFGTPETPAQTPGSQGYGQDTGSFKPPKHEEIQQTIQGSIGGEPGGESPSPAAPPMDPKKHQKKKGM